MPDVQDLVLKLKRREIEGSHACARQTAELLRSVVSQQRLRYTNQAATLVDAVRAVGGQLIAANPVELAVGNIVRRVLHIIREEDLSSTTNLVGGDSDDDNESGHEDHPRLSASALAAAARNTLCAPSLQTLLEDLPGIVAPPQTGSSGGDSEGKSKSDKGMRSKKLKNDVIEAINDLIQEIDNCHEQISEQAVEHIHQNKVIFTLGRSRTVKEFLCAAKDKKRSFRVYIAEGAPRFEGHVLAKELIAKGLQTTVIPDSHIFAMMSEANMVIVGAHAIMADGGVIAPVGVNMLALAAKAHAVPFVVVAGTHKLCPLHPHNPEVLLNEFRSPYGLLDFGSFSDCMDCGTTGSSPSLHVINPAFDYISHKLIRLFITDTGGYNSSYMNRLLSEYYSAIDCDSKEIDIDGKTR